MSPPRETSAALPAPALSESVSGARYVIESEVSRGGMGVVLRAFDRVLQRTVALKVPRTDVAGAVQRLELEGRLVARLQHPAILRVYDAGFLPDGLPFIAMALLPSRTFASAINAARDIEARLRLLPILATVAEGTASAHQQGVVHRDLKPENVLLGDLGETVIIDWGIACAVDVENARVGERAGTEGYMAPEQVRGEAPQFSSDVYALGVMLRELAPIGTSSELESLIRLPLKSLDAIPTA